MGRRRRIVETRAFGIVGYKPYDLNNKEAFFDGWYPNRTLAEQVLLYRSVSDYRCAGMHLFIIEHTRTREQPFENGFGPKETKAEIIPFKLKTDPEG